MRIASGWKRMLGLTGLVMMAAAAQAQTGPDVIGIRPGMSAQEAYNALRAHSNGAKVGIGQMILQGLSEKPVAVIMSVRPLGASPAEVITVWLTLPPSRQVVWAIRRTLTFEQGKEMLQSMVMDGLRQKYGTETDPTFHFWEFDEQGGRVAASEALRRSGCVHTGLMNLPEPQDPMAPQPITPLIAMQRPVSGCSDVVSVRAEFGGAGGRSTEFVGAVTVIMQDTPLARRTQEAYQTFLANGDATKRKEELDKAKQQKGPTF